MSIDYLKTLRSHPARDAACQSMTAAAAGDRDAWLGLWREDGVIEDPVGVSPLDREGNGHRGIEAITAFYDRVLAPVDMRFTIRQSFAAGDECANVGTITTRRPDGGVARTELVTVYRVDADGRLISLRAFWEFEDTVAASF